MRSVLCCKGNGTLLFTSSKDPNYLKQTPHPGRLRSRFRRSPHRHNPYQRPQPKPLMEVLSAYIENPPDPNLTKFEHDHPTIGEVIEARDVIKGPCQNLAAWLACGATVGMGHICTEKLYQKAEAYQTLPCRCMAIELKCLAQGNQYHTCPQFAPTDPKHPWNFSERNSPSRNNRKNPGFLGWLNRNFRQRMVNVRQEQRFEHFCPPDKVYRNNPRRSIERTNSMEVLDSESDNEERTNTVQQEDEVSVGSEQDLGAPVIKVEIVPIQSGKVRFEDEEQTILTKETDKPKDSEQTNGTLTVLRPVSRILREIEPVIKKMVTKENVGLFEEIQVDLFDIIKVNDTYRKITNDKLIDRIFQTITLANRYVLFESTMFGRHYDTPNGEGLARQDAQFDIPFPYREEPLSEDVKACPVATSLNEPCTIHLAQQHYFCSHGYTNHPFYKRPLWNKFKGADEPLAMSILKTSTLANACIVINPRAVVCPAILDNPKSKHHVIATNGTLWCSHGYTNSSAVYGYY